MLERRLNPGGETQTKREQKKEVSKYFFNTFQKSYDSSKISYIIYIYTCVVYPKIPSIKKLKNVLNVEIKFIVEM